MDIAEVQMVNSFVATGDAKAHAQISLGWSICNSWEGTVPIYAF